MKHQGLDPIIRFLQKKKVPLRSSSDLHPIFKISGIFDTNGPLLDYSLTLKPVREGQAGNYDYQMRRYIPIEERATIIMIGCGGTGSHLLPNILQYACTKAKKERTKDPVVIICDGDEVEAKNLVRQRFSDQDLGENKAIALARRYGAVFSTQIKAFDGFLKDSEQLSALIKSEATVCGPIILVGAVDNHRARAIMWDVFMKETTREIWWVDAGNETWHGQVVSGCRNVSLKQTATIHWSEAEIGESIMRVDLPCFFDEYPEDLANVINVPLVPQNECAEQVGENPQTIHANTMAAQCASNLVTQILEGQIRTMSLNFDAKIGAISAKVLSRINIANAYVQMSESRERLKEIVNELNAQEKEQEKELSVFKGIFSKPVEELYTYK